MSEVQTSKLRKHMFHLVLITIAGAMIYGLRILDPISMTLIWKPIT